jgi:putative colanic acid biosynthesis acetyltransferase WcaF
MAFNGQILPAKQRMDRHTVTSPWTLGFRLRLLAWQCSWLVFCRWTPKPLHGWRRLWLRLFGARLSGRPFVHQRARIAVPWHLTIDDRACVGDRANLYSLGAIHLGTGCIVAQEAYLCTGDHDLTQAGKPLVTAPITIGEDAFVGARAFVLAGVTVGPRAVIGAASVVTRDVAAGQTVAGNPARPIDRQSKEKRA